MKTCSAIYVAAVVPLAAALLLTGCAGVVPMPVSSTRVDHGRRVTSSEVAFIQPGVTTRDGVIARLGTSYTALPKNRVIAYSWEMKGGGGVWWVCVLPLGPMDGRGGKLGDCVAADAGTWTGGWRAYFVAFDEAGLVAAATFKNLSPRRSLHEHMQAWVSGL